MLDVSFKIGSSIPAKTDVLAVLESPHVSGLLLLLLEVALKLFEELAFCFKPAMALNKAIIPS